MRRVLARVLGKSKAGEVTARQAVVVACLLAALGLFAAGCGGGSTSSSSGEATTSAESEPANAEPEGSEEPAEDEGGGGSGSSSLVSEDLAAVKKAEEIPHTWEGPTSSPAQVKGAKIAVISCSQA